MLKLTIIIVAGVGLSVLSAFWGLSHNKNYQFENREIKTAAISFFDSEKAQSEKEISAQLTLLAKAEENAVATLQITQKKFSPIDLYVTDTEGRRVRTLIQKYLAAGTYQISWYGETELPAPLDHGLYIVIMDSNDSRQMLKVFLDR